MLDAYQEILLKEYLDSIEYLNELLNEEPTESTSWKLRDAQDQISDIEKKIHKYSDDDEVFKEADKILNQIN